jgi:hypothetical protein
MFGLFSIEHIHIWLLNLNGSIVECAEALALQLVEEHGKEIVVGRAPGVALTIKNQGTYYIRLAHTNKSTL